MMDGRQRIFIRGVIKRDPLFHSFSWIMECALVDMLKLSGVLKTSGLKTKMLFYST